MRAFKSYLTESAKTYGFKVRLACDCGSDAVEQIKAGLSEYKVDSVAKPKRLPMQDHPEFPNMGPVEVSITDVVVCYPATGLQIKTAIANALKVNDSQVMVTNHGSVYDATAAGLEQSNLQKQGESVLANDELTAPKQDDIAGDARISSLMKELASLKTPYELPTAAGGKTPAAGKMPEQQNTSPLGNRKVK